MNSQTKYKDETIKELQGVHDEDMQKFFEIIHYLKTGFKERRERENLMEVEL